jgi:hypothetical protein
MLCPFIQAITARLIILVSVARCNHQAALRTRVVTQAAVLTRITLRLMETDLITRMAACMQRNGRAQPSAYGSFPGQVFRQTSLAASLTLQRGGPLWLNSRATVTLIRILLTTTLYVSPFEHLLIILNCGHELIVKFCYRYSILPSVVIGLVMSGALGAAPPMVARARTMFSITQTLSKPPTGRSITSTSTASSSQYCQRRNLDNDRNYQTGNQTKSFWVGLN